MSFNAYYNNLGINAFAISSVLSHAKVLTLPRLALILPIVTHRDMLRKLAYAKCRVVSFEDFLIENILFFYNFDERYTGSLTATVNALQFLIQIDVAHLQEDGAALVSELPFNKAMGKRAERIHRASANITALVSSDVEVFYLNARIGL